MATGRHTSPLPKGQPQASVPSLENNFVAGLKTEYTGLNFPENACVATNNCTFTRVGNVSRRMGIDYESGFTTAAISASNQAISTFVWENAGGDGNTKLLVVQIGTTLYFYQITNATISSPLSTTKLSSTIILLSDAVTECQYAAGNGYLFVFNPQTDPFYCTFAAGVVTSFRITVQIRDFVGIPENVTDNFRPLTLTAEHSYNLQNQGWTQGSPWTATSSTTNTLGVGAKTFTIQTGLTIANGQGVICYALSGAMGANPSMSGTVTSYNSVSGSLVLSISSFSGFGTSSNWNIVPINTGYVSTWFGAVGVYPSNADVWWQFKNASGVFSPSTTLNNVTLGSGPAPKGFYIIPAFQQLRSAVSSVGGLTDVTTTTRPRTGTWFAGRVWYAGADASFTATGDEPFSTWTENIYFSQIALTTNNFGRCYQTNDPTSETLFSPLPIDGGVITIPGSGSVYRLWPVQNGLIVFAANGIWFITGNQGIGFSATDYNITKISGEHSISSTSFVDVTGYPMFWNADGIYMVMPGQSYTSGQTALQVKNLTLPTIKQFYQKIPISSKLYARGAYNHLTGVIQWLYKNTSETSISDRYSFDSILNFLIYTESFYPWTISSGAATIGINYIEGNTSSPQTPTPGFKYLTANGSNLTFSEERDNVNWQDWNSTGSLSNYVSYFATAYKLTGQGQRKHQPTYIYMYSEIPAYQYKIQGIWDYAATTASNRFSTEQVIVVNKPTSYAKDIRRIKIRGNGYVLQYNITSVTGKPFNLAGWSVLDTIGIQ